MSTTRQLTVAEELVLTSILTEAEKSRQNITDSITKMSNDAFFIASLCARAIADSHGDRCKNVISEGYSILKPDQISKLCDELKKLLTQPQIDNLFFTHMNDDYPETARLLGYCGLSSETLKIIITKRLSISETATWILYKCRKDKDFSLLHFLASNMMPDFMPSNTLLYAIFEIPHTDKNRIATIKKLIDTNASFNMSYPDLHPLKPFDHAVDFKDYEIIEYMTEVALNKENKENIQHIANGIARTITDDKVSSHCNEVIKAVNKKLNPQSKDILIQALRKSLTQEQVNKFFLAHINDKLPSETLNFLIHYGIKNETYIQAIETCTDIKNAEAYLNQLLEKKPQTDTLKNVIRKVINRSENSKDWRLADVLASKIIPENEDAYGDLILTTAKSQQKEIVKKLIKANAKLNWHTVHENKYALHFMIAHKWNDVIEEMLTNAEGIKLLADGIAQVIINCSDNCIDIIKVADSLLKNENVTTPFYDALHASLTKQQADNAFTKHMNDTTWPVLNMLMSYGISPEALMKNIETTTYNNDYPTYIDKLLEKKLDVAQFAKMLDVVFTRAKKNGNLALAEDKISKKIETLLADAEGIKFLAQVVSQVIINSSDHCIDIIKIFEKLLKEKSVNTLFYEALHTSLTQQQAEEAFIKHVSDKTWPVLHLLMGYRVSPKALIKNIETTAYYDDCSTYLDNLLEQKLDATQFTQLMNIVIERSKKHGNWSLIDKIVSKQLEIPDCEKIYGKALLEAIKANISQEIIKKFFHVNTLLNEQTEDTQNSALHLAAERGDLKLTCMLLNAGASTDIKNKEQKIPADSAISAKNYYLSAILKSNNSKKIKEQHERYSIDQLNILYHLFIDDPHSLQLILNEDFSCKAKEEKSESLRTRPELSGVIFNTVIECKTQILLDNKLEIFTQLLKNNLLKIPSSELKEIVSYKDEDGNTALHIAASRGHFDLVKLFLELGANPNKGNKLGETPLTLAEKNKNLTIAKLLKTDPKNMHDQILRIHQYGGGIKTFEQALQKKEPKIKRTLYKALTNDHIAMQEAIDNCRYYNKYGRLMLLSAIGAMYSKLDLHLTCYRSQITGLEIENLSWFRHGVSWADKLKLKYLQEFLSSNLDNLRETAKLDQYQNLDLFTLILLVMKQQLKNPTYKQVVTKHKIESSIRSIMSDELEMSPEEINQQMDRSKYIVDKILGLNQSELKQHAGEKESDLLRAALQGEIYGLRRMVDTYYEDTRIAEYAKFEVKENLFPRHGRLMLFSAVIAPFVGESDYATYLFYIKSLDPKTMLRSNEKIKVLALMKKFYLYSFEVSKSLKQRYNINDPFMLIFLVLEYASKYKKFSATEINTINVRLKESLNSAMLHEGGYTKIESDNFITEKQTQVASIVRSHALEAEDKLQTPIETSEKSILIPFANKAVDLDLPPSYIQASAPPMSLLPPAAKQVHIDTTSIPPLAQVVHSPESSQQVLPPVAMMPPVAVEIPAEELTQIPIAAIQIANPEVVMRASSNPSALFSQSNPTKLSADAMKDMEYLQLREQLLDMPLPPDSSVLKKDENVDQSTSTMKMVVN